MGIVGVENGKLTPNTWKPKMEIKETCLECKFILKDIQGYLCRRYPVVITGDGMCSGWPKLPSDPAYLWCGEWVAAAEYIET